MPEIRGTKFECAFVYTGDIFNGQCHGKGKLYFIDGDHAGEIYEGEFAAGNMSGHGVYMWPSGKLYRGDFLNDRLDGKGDYTWPNGDHHIGDYSNGMKHGYGTFIFADNRRYVGYWNKDIICGEGEFTWPSGSVYRGYFANGYRHGRGTMTFTNKYYYEGDFVYDEIMGMGVWRWPNGRAHYGAFRRGVRNGYGCYIEKNVIKVANFYDDVIFGDGYKRVRDDDGNYRYYRTDYGYPMYNGAAIIEKDVPITEQDFYTEVYHKLTLASKNRAFGDVFLEAERYVTEHMDSPNFSDYNSRTRLSCMEAMILEYYTHVDYAVTTMEQMRRVFYMQFRHMQQQIDGIRNQIQGVRVY